MIVGPSTVGRYKLLRKVGAGGMGVVYEAKDTRDGTVVALKVLLPHAAEEAEGILRFKREFRALARLRHPNIVRVHDAGIENDVPFIAMEFLDGRDIRRYLRNVPEGPIRDREMRRCLRQVFGALAHIHARRIVHRDLKPENILVTNDGRVKLMDFGVARLLRAPTGSSGLLGTFAYMAPEQVTSGEIDGRSDLYAIGVLMYEVLAGDYPFPVEPPAAALHHHVNTVPQDILENNPKADAQLAILTKKLLEKDPLDRLQTAEEAFHYLTDDDNTIGAEESSLPGQLFRPRFVARDALLDELEEIAKAAGSGKGSLLLVEGPSGSGKSRLIQELRHRLKRRTHVLVGQCARERTIAYGAVQSVLDDIASIAQRAPADVTQKIVGRDVALTRVVSPRLADLGGPVTTEHLDASERKVRLHKAMVGVIGRLALSRPVLLVIDDLHWSDASTLELIWDASRTLLAQRPGARRGETVCPVLVILTRRSLSEGPDQAEQLIRRLDEKVPIKRFSLQPLPSDAIGLMVRTMTGVTSVSSGPLDIIVRATHGRPQMVQDLLQAWIDDGTLVRKKGAWLFRGEPLNGKQNESEVTSDGTDPESSVFEDPSGTYPPMGDEVVRTKMGRLSSAARPLLERLALLGRILNAELVSAVAELPEEQFLDAIDELVRAGLLVEEVSSAGVRYRFYHEGFRDAVATTLTSDRRTKLHTTIAKSLESSFRERRAELAHVISRHFKAGSTPERAVRYLEMMAASAAGRGDLDEASRRLSEARSLVDQRPRTPATGTRRLRILLFQIDLFLDFGRPREALDRADPEAAVSARSPDLMRAELSLRRAKSQFALGQLDESLATIGRMRKPAPSRSIGARTLELEGRVRVSRGEYRQARAVLQAAHDIAKDAGLAELAGDLDARIGIVMLHQGDYASALDKLEEGLSRARQQRDARAIAEHLGHIGIVQRARGRSQAALACFREAIEISDAHGVRGELERWSGELGTTMVGLGQFADAEDKITRALRIAIEMGSRQGEATWRGEMGILHLRAGKPDRASTELNRCLAISRDIGFALYEAWSEIYLGAASIERNYDNFAEALQRVEAGLEIGQDLENEAVRIVGHIHLGRILRAEGNVQRARVELESADGLASASQNVALRNQVKDELRRLTGE